MHGGPGSPSCARLAPVAARAPAGGGGMGPTGHACTYRHSFLDVVLSLLACTLCSHRAPACFNLHFHCDRVRAPWQPEGCHRHSQEPTSSVYWHHRVGGADEEGGSPMSGPTSWQCRSTCSKGTDCLAHLKRTWACSPCGALQEGHHCLSLKMARVPINKYTLQ